MECKHGQLAGSCNICELEQEIESLLQQIKEQVESYSYLSQICVSYLGENEAMKKERDSLRSFLHDEEKKCIAKGKEIESLREWVESEQRCSAAAIKERDEWKRLALQMMLVGDRRTADTYNQHVDAHGNLKAGRDAL